MEGWKVAMVKNKLNKTEKSVEVALIRGEYRPVSRAEFRSVAEAVLQRKKNTVLNIRVNSRDLVRLKQKAKKLHIPYQTFISEIIHRFAA